ncbi:hypothetical protein RJ640_016226 [Escallonia rubra]|uniref:Alpha-(1,6)-fucosyltransferase n=1 Tax=Escallonia rubra TaxID=112253 RepID=A0AA88U235_9ASTE|nr:hypothetical protein RJ640_016226 [Escallonia rubra]
MEPLNSQKSLERVVSQKALQMGNSFPCQICVVGFLCGVCLTSVFLAALTSLGTFEFGGISFSTFSSGISTPNLSSKFINMTAAGKCNSKPKEVENLVYSENSSKLRFRFEEKIRTLYAIWSDVLNQSMDEDGQLSQNRGLERFDVPKPPHLENCKLSVEVNQHLDKRVKNGRLPPWTLWKGMLNKFPLSVADEQLSYHGHGDLSEGAYPPWITGSDEENYPFTRKVQRDIWVHQHPLNCSDPSVRFLVVDWERIPGFGIGAQVAGMCGLLAIAINEKRVLVTNYYNRADHDGCKGMQQKVLRHRVWGSPWSYLQPTTEVNGKIVAYHRKMDQRWWRAQEQQVKAVRYLMRFQTEYTCSLLNFARHAAFGWEAAEMVLTNPVEDSLEDVTKLSKSDMEEFVWSNHKPWIPKPLLSMHVRMGDKACEMNVVEFAEYMRLATRVGKRFPHLKTIWLSTEMQDVIDKSRSYPHWKFYYTNVTRQVGNTTMATYEASLGRETSTNYPLVNFLMAAEADFFIGALGSTWCFLIDGMRNTGGKVMSGYLSVNQDRFW